MSLSSPTSIDFTITIRDCKVKFHIRMNHRWLLCFVSRNLIKIDTVQ